MAIFSSSSLAHRKVNEELRFIRFAILGDELKAGGNEAGKSGVPVGGFQWSELRSDWPTWIRAKKADA